MNETLLPFMYLAVAMLGFFVGRVLTAIQYEAFKSISKKKEKSESTVAGN